MAVLLASAALPAAAQSGQPQPARVSATLTCAGLPDPLRIVFVAGDPQTALLDWQGRQITMEGTATGTGQSMRYTARMETGLLAITADRDAAELQAPGAQQAHCRVTDRR